MKKLIDIRTSINRLRNQSLELSSNISSIKEDELTLKYHLCNLKKLSLQVLDIFNSMEKQINFLDNHKLFVDRRKRR